MSKMISFTKLDTNRRCMVCKSRAFFEINSGGHFLYYACEKCLLAIRFYDWGFYFAPRYSQLNKHDEIKDTRARQ